MGWYLTGYRVGSEARRELPLAESVAQLEARLAQLDRSVMLAPGAELLPRGHTNGPHPVALPDRWLETVDDPNPPAGAELLVSGG